MWVSLGTLWALLYFSPRGDYLLPLTGCAPAAQRRPHPSPLSSLPHACSAEIRAVKPSGESDGGGGGRVCVMSSPYGDEEEGIMELTT